VTDARRLRALVVGDSAVRRRRIVDSLLADGGFDVVGSVATTESGPRLVESRAADVIVLEAHELSPSLAFVDAVMTRTPVAILAVRGLPSPEAETALVEAGVVDVITCADASDEEAADASIARAARLVSRIRVVTRRRVTRRGEDRSTPPVESHESAESSSPLVAIGASTGGPAAVAEILAGLPASFPLPILVVVHIGPHFGYSFAEWLGTTSRLPVHQARDHARVEDGHVYVAPPEKHMVLRGDHLALTMEPERHSCRPSVDRLFESVAEERGARAIGCLLTGIGKDGAQGLLGMRQRGATTIAQDEASCAVFGMPREAMALGAATKIASPSQIVSLLVTGAHALTA
jgi:two-component system chemotaxis response regulator CheB